MFKRHEERVHEPQFKTLPPTITEFKVEIDEIQPRVGHEHHTWTYRVRAHVASKNDTVLTPAETFGYGTTEADAKWHAEQEVEHGRRLVHEARERAAHSSTMVYPVDPKDE